MAGKTNLQLPDVDARSFDPAELRQKYRQERDRRVRSDGNDQYVEIKDTYADLLDDPWAEPGFTRAPFTRAMDVLIVGGGFGGLLAAARLRAEGYDDICIVDKAADFGGTWY
jgi:cyclohexanone monooxygenase